MASKEAREIEDDPKKRKACRTAMDTDKTFIIAQTVSRL